MRDIETAESFEQSLANAAINEAYVDHMKSLFGAFVRHLQQNDIEGARKQFRKELQQANQARSEMDAIARDT